MLIKEETLRRIVAGEVRVAYRKWKRPTVRAGGTLLTFLGQLGIDCGEQVEVERLSDAAAEEAGFSTLDQLLRALAGKDDGDVYRIELRFVGADPRVALRESVPGDAELAQICEKLRKGETRSSKPWRLVTLQEIRARPETRAAELAEALGFENKTFKANVRKLKGLGLTESTERGYRLSPRGRAVLQALEG